MARSRLAHVFHCRSRLDSNYRGVLPLSWIGFHCKSIHRAWELEKGKIHFPFDLAILLSPVPEHALTLKGRGAIKASHCRQLLHPGISKESRWFQPKFNTKCRNEISFSPTNKSYNNCSTGCRRDLLIKYSMRLFVLLNTIQDFSQVPELQNCLSWQVSLWHKCWRCHISLSAVILQGEKFRQWK